MDFKRFYFSPEGRVNRKQWWLWLVLPLTVTGILLVFIDMTTGNYDPEAGIGLFSGIFALLSLIPAIIVHIKRFHDRDKSGWWVLIGLIPIIGAIWLLIRARLPQGKPGAKPVRFAGDRLERGNANAMNSDSLRHLSSRSACIFGGHALGSPRPTLLPHLFRTSIARAPESVRFGQTAWVFWCTCNEGEGMVKSCLSTIGLGIVAFASFGFQPADAVAN